MPEQGTFTIHHPGPPDETTHTISGGRAIVAAAVLLLTNGEGFVEDSHGAVLLPNLFGASLLEWFRVNHSTDLNTFLRNNRVAICAALRSIKPRRDDAGDQFAASAQFLARALSPFMGAETLYVDGVRAMHEGHDA